MDTKRKLVDYLLTVMNQLDKKQGRRVSYTDFAKMLDLPNKTVQAMFDPGDPRLPGKANAEKLAIGLGSNEINRILGYPDVDPKTISFMRTYNLLDEDGKDKILGDMLALTEPKKINAIAA